MKKLIFKNKTGQGQHLNTLKEGFLLEPGESKTLTDEDVSAEEMERAKNFFDVTVAPEPRSKPLQEAKASAGKE